MLDGTPYILHDDCDDNARALAVYQHCGAGVKVGCTCQIQEAVDRILYSKKFNHLLEGVIFDDNINVGMLYRNGQPYLEPRGLEFAAHIVELLPRETEILINGKDMEGCAKVAAFLRNAGFPVELLTYDQVIEGAALKPFLDRVRALAEKRRSAPP